MRVLLLVDMEGISQITNFRELWPEYPEYWETGREATTNDTVAAIDGLVAGGATNITVCELHGHPDEAIVDLDQLPESVEWIPAGPFLKNEEMASGHDAVFHLGWHARCGTADGFMSHTNGLNTRVRIDDKPVTEVHVNGWRTGVPLIGVTGDAALGPQLDGALDGLPFLPVKHAVSRSEAEAMYDPEESAAAIQAFAEWCVRNAAQREPTPLPERFVLALSMPHGLADHLDGEFGLRRTSPAVLAKSATDWWYDAEPAVAGAMFESFKTLFSTQTRTEVKKQIIEDWARANEPDWII